MGTAGVSRDARRGAPQAEQADAQRGGHCRQRVSRGANHGAVEAFGAGEARDGVNAEPLELAIAVELHGRALGHRSACHAPGG